MSVKEQRVDGSSIINVSTMYIYIVVKCTLVTGKPALGINKSNFRLKLTQ